jgi:hypothetical protein
VKLEGSLDAFSLPDIFQLLSFTKKSGVLSLRRASIHGWVSFRDGSVTAATADGGRQALARRLVGNAVIGVDDLAAAVERASRSRVGIARALLDAQAVDADVLQSMVREQAVDAVFDLLRWSDGDFSFVIDEPALDDIGVQLAVDDLVAQARGRLDAWEHACQVIPAPDTVLTLPISVREDPHLSRAEWALLALVDGRRSVADLVALAGQGDFAVVSALAGLVERGLLVVRTHDGDEGALALVRRQAILAELEGQQPGAEQQKPEEPEEPKEPKEPAGAFERPHDESRSEPSGGRVASTAAAEAAEADVADQPDESELSPLSSVMSVLAGSAVTDNRTSRAARPLGAGSRAGLSDDPMRGLAAGVAAAAVAADATHATHALDTPTHIERDPSVNKSLLLRLIAGVRGL